MKKDISRNGIDIAIMEAKVKAIETTYIPKGLNLDKNKMIRVIKKDIERLKKEGYYDENGDIMHH